MIHYKNIYHGLRWSWVFFHSFVIQEQPTPWLHEAWTSRPSEDATQEQAIRVPLRQAITISISPVTFPQELSKLKCWNQLSPESSVKGKPVFLTDFGDFDPLCNCTCNVDLSCCGGTSCSIRDIQLEKKQIGRRHVCSMSHQKQFID